MNQNIPDEVMQQMKEERKILGGIIKLGDPFYKNIIKFILVILLLPIIIIYLVLEFIYNSTDDIKCFIWKALDQILMIPSYILTLLIYITYCLKKGLQLVLRFFIKIYEFIERNLYFLKYIWNKIYLALNFIFKNIMIGFKITFNFIMKIVQLVIKILVKVYMITKLIGDFVIQKLQIICNYTSQKLLILSEILFDLFIYISVGLKIILKKTCQLITTSLEYMVIVIYNFYEAITNISGIVIQFIIKFTKKTYEYFKDYIYNPIKYLLKRFWITFVYFLIQMKKLVIAIRNLLINLILKLQNFLLHILILIRMFINKLKLFIRKIALMIVDTIIYILDKFEQGALKLTNLFRICIYYPIKRLVNYILDILRKIYNYLVQGYNYIKKIIVQSYCFFINQILRFLEAVKFIVRRISQQILNYTTSQFNKISNLCANVYNKIAAILKYNTQIIYSLGKSILRKIIVIVEKIKQRMLKRQKRFRKLIKLFLKKTGLKIKAIITYFSKITTKTFNFFAQILRIILNYFIQKLTKLFIFIIKKIKKFKEYSRNQIKSFKKLLVKGLFKLIRLVLKIMKLTFKYSYLMLFVILLRLLRIFAVFSIILDGLANGISQVNNKLDYFGSTLALSLAEGLWICVEYFFKKIKYVSIRLYSYLKALFNITIKVINFVVTTLKQLTQLIFTSIKKLVKKSYTLLKVQLIKIYKFLFPLIKQIVQKLIKLIKNFILQTIIVLKTFSRILIQILQVIKSTIIDIFQKMKKIFIQIWTPIKQEIVKLLIITKNSFILSKNILFKYLIQIQNFIKTILLEVIQILVNTQRQIMAFTKKIVIQFQEYISTQLNSIRDTLKGYLEEIIKGLIEIKNSMIQQTKNIKEQMINIKNQFFQLGVQFKNNFKEIKNSMITTIKQLQQSIKQWRK